MIKNNNVEVEQQTQSVCCQKCGMGVELVSGVIPQHKVKASFQGTKAKFCKASGQKGI